jgi:uncharacterized protein YjbI with pentapeptide repeats
LFVAGGVAALAVAAVVVVLTNSGSKDTAAPRSTNDQTVETTPAGLVSGSAPDTTPATDLPTDLPTDDLCSTFIALATDPATSVDALQLNGAAGCDLTGIDLHGVDLHGVDFTNATLDSAVLDDANLTDALFSGASLKTASLNRATIQNAFFGDANLEGASLANASAESAFFDGAELSTSTFVDVDCRNCSFDGAVLSGSDMANTDLTGANITNADMESVGIAGITIDLTTLLGPAPGKVHVMDATGASGIADGLVTSLLTTGYDSETFPAGSVIAATSVSCRGDFAGSEMRKLAIAIQNFTGAEATEVDFGDIGFQPASDDVACLIVLGSDTSGE